MSDCAEMEIGGGERSKRIIGERGKRELEENQSEIILTETQIAYTQSLSYTVAFMLYHLLQYPDLLQPRSPKISDPSEPLLTLQLLPPLEFAIRANPLVKPEF